MANTPKNNEFLGGGPRFNSVGYEQKPDSQTEAIEAAHKGASPAQRRMWAILAATLVLIGALCAFIAHGTGGVVHTGGRGGAGSGSLDHATGADSDRAFSGQ